MAVNKAEMIASLTADEREHYEERAAIMEYVGDLPREVAEEKALAAVLAEREAKRE